jgi:hypothetical protein
LLLNGETNLVASLEGEKERRNLDAVDLFGEFLLKLASLVGDIDIVVLMIFLTLEFEGGDLIKNLCGVDVVPLFLAIIGDLVLQNCCCCDFDEEE